MSSRREELIRQIEEKKLAIKAELDRRKQLKASAPEATQEQGVLERAGNVLSEFMAGMQRGTVALADMPADFVNSLYTIAKTGDITAPTERIAPSVKGALPKVAQRAIEGGFMSEGEAIDLPVVGEVTPRQMVGFAGEMFAPVPPAAAAAKRMGMAKELDALAGGVPKGVQTEEARLLMSQPAHVDVSGKELVAGQVRNVPEAQRTMRHPFSGLKRHGFDDASIGMIKAAPEADRRQMHKMLRIMAKGKKNRDYADEVRPTRVIGDSLAKRINFINQKRKTAGKAVDKEARKLSRERIDVYPEVQEFERALSDLGITIQHTSDKTGEILKKPKVGFRGSVIEGKNKVNRQQQRIVRDIVERLADTDANTAYDTHRLKSFLSDMVSFDKKSAGLSAKIENAVKDLRHNIGEKMNSKFPEYGEANRVYAKTREAIDNFQSAVGSKTNLFNDKYTVQALGTKARSLLSNAPQGVNMKAAIDDFDKVAEELGGSFKDNLRRLTTFGNILESRFGAFGKTSLMGDVEKVAERAEDLRQMTLAGIAARGTGKAVEWGMGKAGIGVAEDDAIEALDKLLRRK